MVKLTTTQLFIYSKFVLMSKMCFVLSMEFGLQFLFLLEDSMTLLNFFPLVLFPS